MTDDLENRLRRELTGDHYRLDLDPAEVVVREPARRGPIMAAAALAVAAIVAGGSLLPGSGDDRTPVPVVAASALPGLPPGVVAAGDLAEAVGRAPKVDVLPAGGTRTAYLAPERRGVWRVVVVAGGAGEVGLPGVPATLSKDWATGDAQMLVTQDGDTTYAQVHRPDGRKLFLAVTGDDRAATLDATQSLLIANVQG